MQQRSHDRNPFPLKGVNEATSKASLLDGSAPLDLTIL
jgi:hypothetical protein